MGKKEENKDGKIHRGTALEDAQKKKER